MAFRITKAVIPAAGLGTRFLPATKAMPKEMLPVVDKPAIQYVVEEAVAAGLTDVLMITGRNKNALENHFDRVTELEATLEEKGFVLLIVPKVGSPENVDAADIQEAATTAGLKASSTFKVGEDWIGTKLVQGGAAKQR